MAGNLAVGAGNFAAEVGILAVAVGKMAVEVGILSVVVGNHLAVVMGNHLAVVAGSFLAVESLIVAVVVGIHPKSGQGGKALELSSVLGMDW